MWKVKLRSSRVVLERWEFIKTSWIVWFWSSNGLKKSNLSYHRIRCNGSSNNSMSYCVCPILNRTGWSSVRLAEGVKDIIRWYCWLLQLEDRQASGVDVWSNDACIAHTMWRPCWRCAKKNQVKVHTRWIFWWHCTDMKNKSLDITGLSSSQCLVGTWCIIWWSSK